METIETIETMETNKVFELVDFFTIKKMNWQSITKW